MRHQPIGVLVTDPLHPVAAETLAALLDDHPGEFEFHGLVEECPDVTGRGFVRHWPCPPATDAEFADRLLEVVERSGARIVLPWTDVDALVLSGMRDRLAAAGARVVTPGAEISRLCDDKLAAHCALTDAGLPSVESLPIDRLEDLTSAADYLGYPARRLRLKPRSGAGGRGQWRLGEVLDDNHGGPPTLPLDALALAFRRSGSHLHHLLQPEIIGPDVHVDFMAHDGELLGYVARIPDSWVGGINASGAVGLDVPVVRELVARLVKTLRWSSLGNAQLLLEDGARPLFYELNPRASASLGTCAQAGVDLLYAALLYTLDGPSMVRLPDPRPHYFRRTWLTETAAAVAA